MTRGEERPVSKSELRNEIQRRLDILGYEIDREYTFIRSTDDYMSDDYRLVLYFDPHGLGPYQDDYKYIQRIEENYGVTVYAVIANALTVNGFEIGGMLTLLTISGNKAEWQREREDLEARMPIAYVQNLTYPELSEWGTVVLKTHDGIVERIG